MSLSIQLQAEDILLLLDNRRDSIYLLLDHLNGRQAAVDVSAIPQVSTDGSTTSGTVLEFDGPLIQVSLLVFIEIYVTIHSCGLKQMIAVFELNKTCIRFILSAKEDFCYVIYMANATLVRTRVSAQTYARMSTFQGFVTGNRARGSVTWFVTQLGTAVVWALPRAGFFARSTRDTASLLADAVDTAVLAGKGTGWTIPYAGLLTLMRTNKDTLAFISAPFV